MTIQNDVQIRVGQWYERRLHYQHHIGNATKNIRKTQPMQICNYFLVSMDPQQLCNVECFIILEEIVVHSYIVLICFFMAIYSTIDRNVFYIFVSLTKNIGGFTDNKNMSSIEKLAMFLNILAHHEKNRSIKVDYIRSGWSGSIADGRVLQDVVRRTGLKYPKAITIYAIEDI
ncbi:hypothetical protein H5410_004653 [Solanum commersonii]|uniref:DUF8040 domain-containing protein n=1 Tax=Solanum commersonii TaxID=4109 RepID=A0A9J6B899_SOLCO|nr:hypothetical protein H5410_004653 [Solanum commersonii]